MKGQCNQELKKIESMLESRIHLEQAGQQVCSQNSNTIFLLKNFLVKIGDSFQKYFNLIQILESKFTLQMITLSFKANYLITCVTLKMKNINRRLTIMMSHSDDKQYAELFIQRLIKILSKLLLKYSFFVNKCQSPNLKCEYAIIKKMDY
ncbi:unnamed protein product (macronuclear) [Paramecium tetraurelia]|uniref:Uncharacterized protein n=1 Tax=Paramecium tetraurelia TaxID=5888 RepID=A0CK31_PARTE|nr:uncharacterized protein GSPATT00000860001 [Paramecium tetraurelia]CAK71148.1 unnamed protein product [Paramecium tetraurelia]|eukprot:XP_001438545.1 hypothetical protein (macronuclear) [Paramecium tetraurelia strain d4-2]